MEIEGVLLNVIGVYGPQVWCELEDKEEFWEKVEQLVQSITREERVVIGADLHGHVGEGNNGDEGVAGGYGVGERNAEGQMIVNFAKREMVIVSLEVKAKKKVRAAPGIKWWKLDEEDCKRKFREGTSQAWGEEDRWSVISKVVREKTKKILGVTSGRGKGDKETWWWNGDVQDSIHRKRPAKENLDRHRDEESNQEYKEIRSLANKEVVKAKEKSYHDLYERLNNREREKDPFPIGQAERQCWMC
ncbi:uncharacterized protein [Penaeus vannamei]|uniref:uncharacterized protein n=1 Tax=Penaeus vannamei TaxID=6689 RepID=UPI00387F3C49